MAPYQHMETCFLCRSEFPFGQGKYYGKPIQAWGIMACDSCLKGNWDGIVPGRHPHLEAYLNQRAISPAINAKGWIDWPKSN